MQGEALHGAEGDNKLRATMHPVVPGAKMYHDVADIQSVSYSLRNRGVDHWNRLGTQYTVVVSDPSDLTFDSCKDRGFRHKNQVFEQKLLEQIA